jgi:hypothetical protein
MTAEGCWAMIASPTVCPANRPLTPSENGYCFFSVTAILKDESGIKGKPRSGSGRFLKRRRNSG